VTSGGLRELHPAYFALVMATGIVSLAAWITGFPVVAQTLFAINLVAYPTLWVLLLLRVRRFPRDVLADLCSHARGVGFFTIVAATCVLGSQCLLIAELRGVSLALWCFGILLWVLSTYGILTLLTVQRDKPSLAKGLNGGWLVAVVATQSVALLGAQLAPGFEESRGAILFACLVIWLAGGMLYVWTISIIFYRYTFCPMEPGDLAPPYWINMGAVAISTLAGTFLIERAALSPLLAELLPFVKGVTVTFWATATWWIPMLLTLGIWRHGVRRFPLRYDPMYWGAVFPLGMYTVCTFRLASLVQMPLLRSFAEGFVFVAFAAWALCFAGLLRKLVRLGAPSSAQAN